VFRDNFKFFQSKESCAHRFVNAVKEVLNKLVTDTFISSYAVRQGFWSGCLRSNQYYHSVFWKKNCFDKYQCCLL